MSGIMLLYWQKVHFAIGCDETKATASATDNILSASVSGISMENSSSISITISTASRESKSRSSLNRATGVTFSFLI